MNNYTVTVIKTGNSYALRVPKKYIDDAQLTLGQKGTIPLLTPELLKQNRARIQETIKQLQKIGAFRDIKDPVAWQREMRKDRPLPGRE